MPAPTDVIWIDNASYPPKKWKFKRTFKESEVWMDHSEMLLERIRQNQGRNLQVFLDADLFNAIVADAVLAEWKPAADSLLKEIRTIVESFFIDAFERSCELKGLPNIYPRYMAYQKTKLLNTIDAKFRTAQEAISNNIETEVHPSTFNHYLNENIQKQRYSKILMQLSQLQSEKGDLKYAIVQAIFEQNQHKPIESYVVEELSIVLTAYAKVAEKRVIDEIPNIIELRFVQSLSGITSNDLFDSHDEQALQLLAPSTDIMKAQKIADTMVNRLKEAKKKAEEMYW